MRRRLDIPGPLRPRGTIVIEDSRNQPWSHRRWMSEALAGALVGLVCMGVAFVVFRIWPWELDLLWGAGGDMTPVAGVLKGSLEGSDITLNPRLGFPGFLDAAQFPLLTDLFHWAHLIPMAWLLGDAVTAVNAYVFVGFFRSNQRLPASPTTGRVLVGCRRSLGGADPAPVALRARSHPYPSRQLHAGRRGRGPRDRCLARLLRRAKTSPHGRGHSRSPSWLPWEASTTHS